jgi:hypothetical protein
MPTGLGGRNSRGHGAGLLHGPMELGSTGAMVNAEVAKTQTSVGNAKCDLIAPVSGPTAESEASRETASQPGG